MSSSSSKDETNASSSDERRPSTLVAVVKPIQASSSSASQQALSDDELTLSRLPSPMERSGSIVGDPQLPVPVEFMDKLSSDEDNEDLKVVIRLLEH